MYGTKEFYDLMDHFEKIAGKLFFGHKIERAKRDNRHPSEFYYDGFVNQMFVSFMAGYQYHKRLAELEQYNPE